MPRVYFFQQDNDPKHASYLVQEWLLYNVPKLLKTPPQSSDRTCVGRIEVKIVKL